MRGRNFHQPSVWLSTFLCLLLMSPAPILAQPMPVNLDLTSTNRSASASAVQNFQPAAIVVAGQTQNVTAASMLTPAQMVALAQVLNTGQQSIRLGINGNAVGGTLNLSAQLNQQIANLVVPQSVNAISQAATLDVV